MIPSVLDTFVTGVAGNSNYSFPFRTFESQDVGVKVRLLADGTETQLSLTTHFTLNGIGDLGGSINLKPGFAWMDGANLHADYEIHIYFVVNTQQLSKYRDLGNNGPWEIEKSFDRLTMFFKGLLGTAGELGRAIKLPLSIQPSEFNTELPADLRDSADTLLAVNDTLDGFKMVSILDVGTPGSTQTIGADGSIAVTPTRRQHVRIQSDGGSKALNVKPFGSNPALFVDGMEIVVEGMSQANFNTLAEDDDQYGFLGNGGIEIKYPYVVTFLYDGINERFKLKSNGAW